MSAIVPAPAPAAALSPARREASMAALSGQQVDIVIVGGGVVGAGAALDAASRGLSVALLERRDLAAGASSASSKLVHGGVRYLQMLDFGLVREALAERGLLLRLAPHLVQPVPFLYPLRHRLWERRYVGAGLTLYDALARLGGDRLPRHRQLSAARARALAPGLRPDLLHGGVEYHDAQVDDARYVVALARTAAGLGAHVITGATVAGFLSGGGESERGGERGRAPAPRGSGRVVGVRVQLEDGRQLEIGARAVVAATGAWSADLAALAGLGEQVRLQPSKGVHLVVPRAAIALDRALVAPTDRSVLFVLPWGEHWLVGTTDTTWSLGPDHPTASREDIDYLLGEINRLLVRPLSRGDVVSVYAGLRPLVASGGAETSKVSREHAVSRLRDGLYLVTGGKYTTYRVMARDAIDAVVGDLGGKVRASATERVAIAGAAGFAEAWERRAALAADHGLEREQIERLLHRYGALASEVLASARDEPSLLSPLAGGEPYLAAEARYAASHEGARHLEDVIARRTRLAIERADRGVAAAAAAAGVAGEVLGWNASRQVAEVSAYARAVEARRRAEEASGDESALRLLVEGGRGVA